MTLTLELGPDLERVLEAEALRAVFSLRPIRRSAAASTIYARRLGDDQ